MLEHGSMYKRTSQAIQRGLHAGKPHPSRGLIVAEPPPIDQKLNLPAIRAEEKALKSKSTKLYNAMTEAGDPALKAKLGRRLNVVQHRLGELRKLAHEATMLANTMSGASLLKQAMRETLTPEQCAAVYDRADELRDGDLSSTPPATLEPNHE